MDTVDKYNKLLTSIYTNLMLREIAAIKHGSMKDLTFHEIHAIEIIGDLEEASLSQIAGKARVTQSTMSTMVEKLVKKGLIERIRSDDDRRVTKIRLTRKGRAAHAEHENVHREVTKDWLSILDRREREVLLQAMEKMAAHFK
jgi:DNA-binding MarR family transcriptional regulator